MAQSIAIAMVDELPSDLFSAAGEEDGDWDSLFGGDDDTDPTSFFTEVDAASVEPSSQEPDSELDLFSPQQHSQQAADPAAQLHFPELQALGVAQSDHQHTAVPQLFLPAVPDPLGAPLSHRDGRTSGDLVVSTQYSAHDNPGPGRATPPPDDAALEAELESLWESMTSQKQPVNAQAGSQDSDSTRDDDIILPAQIPGFRYGNSNSNMSVRLPRRVDLDSKLAEDLAYYLTLRKSPSPPPRLFRQVNG